MKFDNIGFVWTYECNTDCSYCYAEKYIKPYKWVELSFRKFEEIVLRLKQNGVKNVIFIWGEPALWKQLNKAIAFVKQIWLHSVVMSNGMIRIQEIPDKFYIHINVLLFTKNTNIVKNILHYSKTSKVILVYNVFKIEKYHLKIIKGFLASLNLPISLWFEFNHKINREIWEYFYELFYYLRETIWLEVEPIGPIPACIFTEDQFSYLKTEWLKSYCSTPSFKYSDSFLTINPDGNTILPCSTLPIYADINMLLKNDLKKYLWDYWNVLRKIRSKKEKICEDCELWWKTCQWGWLIRKFWKKTEWINL